jgi:type I site-specific restriction endonuclease
LFKSPIVACPNAKQLLRKRKDAQKLNIPINAFDIIIADEYHRGYTATEESKWCFFGNLN